VFGHHHRSEAIAERIDHLMAAVFLPDDRERLEQLRAHLSPDFVYISPGAVFDGAEGLSEAFSHYRHDAWRHAALRRTSAVDVHHGQFRYSWARSEQGAVTMEGWSFGQLGDDGLIQRIVAFDGLVPGPPT
jgi:hypothetical protein